MSALGRRTIRCWESLTSRYGSPTYSGFLSTVACVAWGVWRWNYAGPDPDEPDEEVRHWAEEEDKVESEL